MPETQYDPPVPDPAGPPGTDGDGQDKAQGPSAEFRRGKSPMMLIPGFCRRTLSKSRRLRIEDERNEDGQNLCDGNGGRREAK